MSLIHIFTKEELENGKKFSAEEIAQFLENFRLIQENSKLSLKSISVPISEPMFYNLEYKSKLQGISYQDKINELIRDWLNAP